MPRSVNLVATLAFAVGLALPAAAQRAGTYGVEGSNPGGAGTYGGSATLTPSGTNAWQVMWQVGGEAYRGVGLVTDGVLSVGYVSGRQPGVAVYRVLPDGTLDGRWSTGGGVGTERMVPR